MAWVDDRAWCHPKLTDLSDRAFRVYICGLAYSSGFGRRGNLTPGQQRTIGSSARIHDELVSGCLWDPQDDGSVYIHDWKEHNEKRDDKREKDRLRKRRERESARLSNGASAGQSTGTS